MASQRKKQGGYVLAGTLIAVVIAGFILQRVALYLAEAARKEAIELQAQRLASVANGVIRYQSSGANPPTSSAPLDQWNVAGAPFQNGAIHTGLDWLKETSCSATSTAPSNYLPCDAIDTPNLGGDTVYRFVISNDGSTVNTSVQVVQRDDPTIGIMDKGVVDIFLASAIATKAESRVMFTAMGATNTLFKVDRTTGVLSADVGLVVADSPYIRKDGKVPFTHTQPFLEGAGIKGAEFVATERLADYDRATDSVSTTRYIDMDGDSALENLATQKLTSPEGSIDDLTSTFVDAVGGEFDSASISDLTLDYFNQTNPFVQNQIAGELAVGSAGDRVVVGGGNIGMDGVIYNNDDNSYFIDLKEGGIARLDDIVLTSLGNRSISEVMPKMSLKGTSMVAHGSLLPLPYCGTSGSPRLLIDKIRESTMLLDSNGIGNLPHNIEYSDADIVGSNWVVAFTTHSQEDGSIIEDPNGLGIAQVYCYYP